MHAKHACTHEPHKHLYTRMHTYTHMRLPTHLIADIYAYKHTRRHIHTHIVTYIIARLHTHTSTHARTHARTPHNTVDFKTIVHSLCFHKLLPLTQSQSPPCSRNRIQYVAMGVVTGPAPHLATNHSLQSWLTNITRRRCCANCN